MSVNDSFGGGRDDRPTDEAMSAPIQRRSEERVMNELRAMKQEWGRGGMPRVVPELVARTTAPELLAGLEGAMIAWRRVAANVAAPAADQGRMLARDLWRLAARGRGQGLRPAGDAAPDAATQS